MQSCRSLVHKKTLRREQLEKAVRAAKRPAQKICEKKRAAEKREQLKKAERAAGKSCGKSCRSLVDKKTMKREQLEKAVEKAVALTRGEDALLCALSHMWQSTGIGSGHLRQRRMQRQQEG